MKPDQVALTELLDRIKALDLAVREDVAVEVARSIAEGEPCYRPNDDGSRCYATKRYERQCSSCRAETVIVRAE